MAIKPLWIGSNDPDPTAATTIERKSSTAWRRPTTPPALRLIRGRALLLAIPPRRVVTTQTPAAAQEPRSRVAQLAFVVAMTAIGLVALATSVGQILARGM